MKDSKILKSKSWIKKKSEIVLKMAFFFYNSSYYKAYFAQTVCGESWNRCFSQAVPRHFAGAVSGGQVIVRVVWTHLRLCVLKSCVMSLQKLIQSKMGLNSLTNRSRKQSAFLTVISCTKFGSLIAKTDRPPCLKPNTLPNCCDHSEMCLFARPWIWVRRSSESTESWPKIGKLRGPGTFLRCQ